MNAVHRSALERSLEVRHILGLDFKSPVPLIDACRQMGIAVRFVGDISMDGVYVGVGLQRPTILLSSLRPLPRRLFTCAHELGHHVYSDGFVVDSDLAALAGSPPMQEARANTFAAHLLMPRLGVASAFTVRGWNPIAADPTQIFTVACQFGVGYTTLIRHMQFGLGVLPEAAAERLLKTTPARIRLMAAGLKSPEPIAIADQWYPSSTLDTEVGSFVMLPPKVVVDCQGLEALQPKGPSTLFKVLKPGIHRASIPESDWAIFVRACRRNYQGLAQYRHLEDEEGD